MKKPRNFEDYLTLAEVGQEVGRDPRTIRKLENENKLPKAKRMRVGKLNVRLWSPAQVEEIKEILSHRKAGRPRGS